jgi:OmpA-OmpF porin, OOP family
MSQRKILGGVVLVLLASASASAADDSGFYLGASFGEATQNNAVFHGEDETFRWLAGYEFNKYLAIEGGFVDAGKQKDNIGNLRVTSASNGVFLSVLAKYPIGERFAPYARFGGVSYETQTTLSNGVANALENSHGEDIAYGGGLEFKPSEHFRLRADYEKVRVPDVAFDIYSLVATWKF